MKNKLIVMSVLLGVFALAVLIDSKAPLFASDTGLKDIKADLKDAHSRLGDGGGLIFDSNELFLSSGECNGCHGFDLLEVASVDSDGNDINVVDDWRSTMMANSAKDPFWIAKVAHETMVYPELKNEIETSCTDCHSPLGYFNAFHIGLDEYTMADLAADSIAKDGVSCNACHQLLPDSVGKHFSGEMYYQEQNLYGPYEDPFGGPMESFVGFSPVFDDYVNRSEACASCHTLETETIDYEGNITGDRFFEQATYHEWLNSAYNSDDKTGIQCQGCHMPRRDENVIIASNLAFLPPRNPFYKHEFAGANTFMLQLMKDNLDTLDIRASSAQMDSTIMRTYKMLQQHTLDIQLTQVERNDSTTVEVLLLNKAGHKFPSGYPSRLAYVELLALNMESGEDTVFASGLLDEDYNIVNRNEDFEPHYDFINSEEQVQIYENVLGDVNDDVTTVLSRAKTSLKDNRFVPIGFSTTHEVYDTTEIAGTAIQDVNFNHDDDGVEGSGSDKITYKFFTGDASIQYQITAKVYYQTAPPKWMESMFEYSADVIDHFKQMYDDADHTPVLIGADTLLSPAVGIEEISIAENLWAYPNPTMDGNVIIQLEDQGSIERIEIYDVSGKLIEVIPGLRHDVITLELPSASGYYFVKVQVGREAIVKKVMRL